jgi:polyhydroxyalkanoate synthesis regulator phasin
MASLAEKFSRADAKTRIVVIFGVIIGVVVAIIVGSKFFGSNKASGNAKVAGAPSLQSVPGGQLTPEYYRALMQANQQNAQQAQVSGGSAVPTLVNAPTQETTPAPSGNCTVMCPGGDSADVSDELGNLVKSGKISQADANQLASLAKTNVPVNEYSNYLSTLVKQGKLSPDAARKLLEIYTKQHAEASVADSARTMDAMIKSGRLPIEAATSLLNLQKKGASVQEYASALNELVRQGKISPESAAILLAQYTQQQAHKASEDAEATLHTMAAAGQISAETANDLLALQKRGAPITEYQAELNRLVAAGKMTPDTAAKLLGEYQNARVDTGPASTLNGIIADAESDAASDVSGMVAEGKLTPTDAANLLGLQKNHTSVQDYNNSVDQLVKQGKLTPDEAAKLTADYAKSPAADVGTLLASGKISAATANAISDLANSHATPAVYAAALDQMVAQGKISVTDATRLKAENANESASADSTADISGLVGPGKLTQSDAGNLVDAQKRQVSPQEYAAQIDKLVSEGKLTPAESTRLKTKYFKLASLHAVAQRLTALQGNNATPDQYNAELSRAVQEKVLTPEQAANLMSQYKALSARVPVVGPVTPAGGANPNIQSNAAGAGDFSVLQQRLAAQAGGGGGGGALPAAGPAGPDQAAQYAAAEAQAEAEAAKARQQEISNLMSQMSGQAQALITAWQPTTMAVKTGNQQKTTTTTTTQTGANGSRNGTGKTGKEAAESSGPPLIKAGTILFAVLTTAVDSDYPDTPVMATIVSGQYKGAVVMGKLALAQGQDKVSLNFTLMNMDSWDKGKNVTAFAIDPDTARTVMASNVNYHYMLRYGTMFASSFVTGYANGISQSGSTTSSGIFGTTNTHPQLSPGEKIAVALGQVGTTFGTALANYVNTPTTVKVNSGVGLGILFMADVT